jgi:hypothetical protein
MASTNDDPLALLERGRGLLVSSNGQLSVVMESEQCFRRALQSRPDDPDVLAYLGWSLDTQGRWSEAMPLFRRALQINPDQEVAKIRHSVGIEELDLFDTGEEEGKPSRRFSKFPETIAEFLDLDKAVREHVISHTPRDAISVTPTSKIVTIGSCFASNLAIALTKEGINAKNLSVGEIINSTFANLQLLQWALGVRPTVSGELKYSREQLNELLGDADVMIYTLGVAPCFFDKETGEFVLVSKTEAVRGVIRGKYVFRNTTVEENVANIRSIITLIREHNPKCRFVFSLSPVPLTSTLENRSAIEADCLSKATLRVAVDQIASSTPGCVYWPSFEMVRWLGAYVPGMYGAEDGTPHHVSESAVGTIIRLFLETYSKPGAA